MIDRWAELGSHRSVAGQFFQSGARLQPDRAGLAAPRAAAARCRSWRLRSFRSWARKRRLPACGGVLADSEREAAWSVRSDSVGGHVQQLFSSGDEPGGAERAARRWIPRDRSARSTCAAGVRSTISACSTKPSSICRNIMSVLGPQIDAGIPIVVLEPSCASVFRDELRNLFPQDARAAKLRSQTFLLSEFLERNAPEFKPPQLSAQSAAARTLPSQIADGHERRGIGAAQDGRGRAVHRFRLLRHGRPVRLREGKVRGVAGAWASACCCRLCAKRRRRR